MQRSRRSTRKITNRVPRSEVLDGLQFANFSQVTTDEPTPRPGDLRFARLANVLAAAVRDAQLQPSDALRVLKHQLRLFNRNRALKVTRRSTGAQDVIERYAADQIIVPKNGSTDALHSDHVFPLDESQLHALTTIDDWLAELPRLQEVVCVTAAENEQLRLVEATGVSGWQKYNRARVSLLAEDGGEWVPLDLVAVGLLLDEA